MDKWKKKIPIWSETDTIELTIGLVAFPPRVTIDWYDGLMRPQKLTLNEEQVTLLVHGLLHAKHELQRLEKERKKK